MPTTTTPNQPPPIQDPFLTNDYYPLQLGNKAIITALRADEVSSNGDLYKVISSSTVSTSTYKVVGEDGVVSTTAGGSSGSSGSNATVNGTNGHLNGAATTNGTHTHLPQNQNKRKSNAVPHPTLKYTNSLPIPHSMRQKIEEETKMSSLMGILPQGNMIWISVDDRLFLWEYGSSLEGETFSSSGISAGWSSSSSSGNGDFVCFRVPSGQCVVSVGLVKPKKGEFLLVIGTSLGRIV